MFRKVSGSFAKCSDLIKPCLYSSEAAVKPANNQKHPETTTQGNVREQQEPEWKNAKPFAEIPRIKPLFFLKNFLPGGKLRNASMFEISQVLYNTYGPIVYMEGFFRRRPSIQLFEPKDFETVFRNEGQYPSRPSFDTFVHYRKNIRADVFKEGGGLLSEQGIKWYEFRTISNPLLLKPSNVHYYIPQVNEIADDFLDKIKDNVDSKTKETSADFQSHTNRWVLESLVAIALNTRLGLLGFNTNTAAGEELLSNVTAFFRLAYELEFLPSIWRYYETPKFKKIMGVLDKMTNLCLEFIEQARREIEYSRSSDDHSILAQLLKQNEHAAVIMAIDMLIAGIDSTSSAFISCVYNLAKNQNKQDRLRADIMKALPSKDTPVTEHTLHSLPYLKSCIKETLRYSPILAGTGRETQTDLVLAGYQVPKGNIVICNSLLTSKNEKHFAKADTFMPERWLRVGTHPNEACPMARNDHPFAYLPFGFGARMCIGKSIAHLLLETMLLKLFRNYVVEWHHPDMKYEINIISTPKGDIKFKLIDID